MFCMLCYHYLCIYLFCNFHSRTWLERGAWGRERRNWEKHWRVTFCACPSWRASPQPRHVFWPRVTPATLRSPGWHSTNWATMARLVSVFVFLTYFSIFRSIYFFFDWMVSSVLFNVHIFLGVFFSSFLLGVDYWFYPLLGRGTWYDFSLPKFLSRPLCQDIKKLGKFLGNWNRETETR